MHSGTLAAAVPVVMVGTLLSASLITLGYPGGGGVKFSSIGPHPDPDPNPPVDVGKGGNSSVFESRGSGQ